MTQDPASNSQQTLANSHYDLGLKALKKSNLLEAEGHFAAAIAAAENFVPAWIQLGITWDKSNRISEAAEAFQMAVHLEPHNVDALYNLGLCLAKLGREDDSLKYFSDAATLSESADIAKEIGKVYYKGLNYKTSSFFYLKAYQKDSSDADIIKPLAVSLFQEGDTDRAVILMRGLFLSNPRDEIHRSIFVDLINKWCPGEFETATKTAIEYCLDEDRVRHRNFTPAWCATFLSDPEFESLRSSGGVENLDFSAAELEKLLPALSSKFLIGGLSRLLTSNAKIEPVFTNLRRYFLTHWRDHETWPRAVTHFLVALGLQCFYNDYVYFREADEKDALAELEAHLRPIISAQKTLTEADTKLLALLSCYQPLYEMDFLTKKPALPPALKKSAQLWLRVQYVNPLTERALIPTIPGFTKIEDQTSLDVQKMYEQRPYPRWNSLAGSKTSQYLRDISENLEILVAGCGTGQEPCLYANLLPHARITAIDLSRSSIAYGMRMAHELGFGDRINFLHGDLMKVGELDKQFDYVVSSGVLHHLKDPETGFAAILATLKPAGKMSIMLYSKIARDHLLNPAAEYIAEKKYTSNDEDIRQFRQDILKMPAGDPRTLCAQAGDFFTLYECNDLLFHVQEHRYSFPMIGDLAGRHGMRIFHVGLSPQRRKEFAAEFPEGEITNMETMNRFELNHPEAFGEMYKIYLTRASNTAPHALDQLITLGAV